MLGIRPPAGKLQIPALLPAGGLLRGLAGLEAAEFGGVQLRGDVGKLPPQGAVQTLQERRVLGVGLLGEDGGGGYKLALSMLHLHAVPACCSCMLLLYGAAACCSYRLQLHAAAARCSYMLPLHAEIECCPSGQGLYKPSRNKGPGGGRRSESELGGQGDQSRTGRMSVF